MIIQANNRHTAANSVSMLATQIANWLTRKHIPFREAHAITGKIVRYCIEQNLERNALPLENYPTLHPAFDASLYAELHAKSRVEGSNTLGGTSRQSVEQQLALAAMHCQITRNWLAEKSARSSCNKLLT